MPPTPELEKTQFFRHFPVPRETEFKLIQYVEMIQESNQRINLVSESTLPHIWSRHILDSAQLLPHIPTAARTLADLGSGAGLPGIVLAIMGVPGVHLVESIGKKASFLQQVAKELNLDIKIIHDRIENIKTRPFDIVTARALKPLPELLKLAKPLINKKSMCLLLKGQKAELELTEARKYWTFACTKTPSLSDPSGMVLKIADLKEINRYGRRISKRNHK